MDINVKRSILIMAFCLSLSVAPNNFCADGGPDSGGREDITLHQAAEECLDAVVEMGVAFYDDLCLLFDCRRSRRHAVYLDYEGGGCGRDVDGSNQTQTKVVRRGPSRRAKTRAAVAIKLLADAKRV